MCILRYYHPSIRTSPNAKRATSVLWQEPFSQRTGGSPGNNLEADQSERSPWSPEQMPPRGWTVLNFGKEQHRRIPVPSMEIRPQSSGSGMPGGRKRILPHLYALQLGDPRSAAIFNSKTCQLREARNKSCYTSERESWVGTAAFYTRLAHQLSNSRKLPSSASPGTWQSVCGGWSTLFIVVAPGPSTVLGGMQYIGAKLDLQVLWGCLTSGHLYTSATRLQIRGSKIHEACISRIPLQWVHTDWGGFWSTFVARGELENSILTDPGNRTLFAEVFSEPRQQLLRGNRLRECVRNEKNAERRQISPQHSLRLDWCHGLASADLELVSPGSHIPRSFRDSLTQQRCF